MAILNSNIGQSENGERRREGGWPNSGRLASLIEGGARPILLS